MSSPRIHTTSSSLKRSKETDQGLSRELKEERKYRHGYEESHVDERKRDRSDYERRRDPSEYEKRRDHSKYEKRRDPSEHERRRDPSEHERRTDPSKYERRVVDERKRHRPDHKERDVSERRRHRSEYERRRDHHDREDSSARRRYSEEQRGRSRSPPELHRQSLDPRRQSSAPPPPEEEEKEQPNFQPTGLLAAETNTVNGAVGKYNEPMDAQIPKIRWRVYVFKGQEQIDVLHIHRQSAYLLGRDRRIVDIPLDHASCSQQHAAIQFRAISLGDPLSGGQRVVRPYLIDLESTNGTKIQGQDIPPSRYVEIRSGDVVTFGCSTRDYVFLPEEGQGTGEGQG